MSIGYQKFFSKNVSQIRTVLPVIMHNLVWRKKNNASGPENLFPSTTGNILCWLNVTFDWQLQVFILRHCIHWLIVYRGYSITVEDRVREKVVLFRTLTFH